MPSGRCKTCGKMTNSATSNWWASRPLYFGDMDGVATECYLAWDEEGHPVRGCGYDRCRQKEREYVDECIKKGNAR